jgi:hypothetical protein
MDTIAIPLIQASSAISIAEALEELKRWRRAGLVVEDEDNYRMLYIRHLLEARRDGINRLASIKGGYPVHLLEPVDMSSFGLDLVRPLKTVMPYQALFSSFRLQDKDYALAGGTRDTAIIVTRRETETYTLGLSGGFQCNGVPINHFFPDPQVYNGQPCPKYPECSLPGGGWPVVSPV